METTVEFTRSERAYLLVRGACRRILRDYQSGKITTHQAFYRLELIEKAAFKAAPDAEPDGDITYSVADTRDKIERYARENKNK